MDQVKLRSWWWAKQGLDGSLQGKAPREALLKSGWARSIGGANPYITIFSRNGQSMKAVDDAAAAAEIHELPSARGCTYVLPQEDFALGLRIAEGLGEHPEIAQAKKYLGVTDEELDNLSEAALLALEKGAMDSKQIKDQVGDAARSLGEEGKKRGMSSTLPMVLGRLQTRGQIRRVPVEGRLDRQRYKYVLWKPSPFEGQALSYDDALAQLAEKYFRWIGPASTAHFQWFTGLSGKAAKEVLSRVSLVPVEGGSLLLIHEDELAAFGAYEPPQYPAFNLIASLDALLAHRHELAPLLDECDKSREVAGEKSILSIGSLLDLPTNAIVDRGRLIGLWEYDPIAKEMVTVSWVGKSSALEAAIQSTRQFIEEQLGDCRSFSLDSPESRQPKLAMLRQLSAAELVSA